MVVLTLLAAGSTTVAMLCKEQGFTVLALCLLYDLGFHLDLELAQVGGGPTLNLNLNLFLPPPKKKKEKKED